MQFYMIMNHILNLDAKFAYKYVLKHYNLSRIRLNQVISKGLEQ